MAMDLERNGAETRIVRAIVPSAFLTTNTTFATLPSSDLRRVARAVTVPLVPDTATDESDVTLAGRPVFTISIVARGEASDVLPAGSVTVAVTNH